MVQVALEVLRRCTI